MNGYEIMLKGENDPEERAKRTQKGLGCSTRNKREGEVMKTLKLPISGVDDLVEKYQTEKEDRRVESVTSRIRETIEERAKRIRETEKEEREKRIELEIACGLLDMCRIDVLRILGETKRKENIEEIRDWLSLINDLIKKYRREAMEIKAKDIVFCIMTEMEKGAKRIGSVEEKKKGEEIKNAYQSLEVYKQKAQKMLEEIKGEEDRGEDIEMIKSAIVEIDHFFERYETEAEETKAKDIASEIKRRAGNIASYIKQVVKKIQKG